MKPTAAQRHVLRGLAQDRAKAFVEYDPPTGIVWQHWGLRGFGQRVRPQTFHALLRRGWIEENGWRAAFCAIAYSISATGLEALSND